MEVSRKMVKQSWFRRKAAKNKAKITCLITLFIGSILLMIAYVFNHQAVTALMIGSDTLAFFGFPVSALFILDLSYVLFGISYFICVLVFLLALFFKWRR